MLIQEARIEQMNDQRRRMKQQELKRAAAALLEERRAAKEVKKRQEDDNWRAQKEADAVILHTVFIKNFLLNVKWRSKKYCIQHNVFCKKDNWNCGESIIILSN